MLPGVAEALSCPVPNSWRAELSARAFCTFLREFPPCRWQGAAIGQNMIPDGNLRVYSCHVRSRVAPGRSPLALNAE
jgi:hypothetical protein